MAQAVYKNLNSKLMATFDCGMSLSFLSGFHLLGWAYRNTHFLAKLSKVIAKHSIAFSVILKTLLFSGKVIAKCRLSLLSKVMSMMSNQIIDAT